MRRKNLILTLYLASPIVVVIGLTVLIFVTLDKEKLMADAPAIGAGAGDTGDANAIGQWLAGRDPDAVSIANKAKRERLLIDPRDWPGGIELVIPGSMLPGGEARIELRRDGEVESVRISGGGPGARLVLGQEQVGGASIWLVQPDAADVRIYTELRIPPPELAVSDPMVVEADG